MKFIAGGTITAPAGFRAGAVSAGVKKTAEPRLDLGMLFSEERCVTAGVFTTSRLKSAPVLLCQEKLPRGHSRAIVANSGCANAYTGEAGLNDAREMGELAAFALGVDTEDVFVASTGVTGQRLPMEVIRSGIRNIALSDEGGHDFARAIMTTDTVPKEAAVAVQVGDSRFTIGGVAKGAGMIHPNMATMLCFLTTDAAVELDFLRAALRRAADVSFNMISVDGDTSPSDTVLLMANGLAKNPVIAKGSPMADAFERALTRICINLAMAIVRYGEGATRLIEVTVNGAATVAEARMAARTIVGSSLVKTAVYGGDPNWGRIIAALARSGAGLVESKIALDIGKVKVLRDGKPVDFSEADVMKVFKGKEVPIKINLNLGTASATAWGCDLTPEYVKINSEYMT
ncbi:MAG: bifunctional glutamate N-acetyltransferase/amino-acid acetyltransferase ArgJ [Chloroflexi bacterium]|nr:bifunctional glutamate N-acetyltransferase/amino-acid acetyltransferase ArgJ [Chloroflexota bacterium]